MNRLARLSLVLIVSSLSVKTSIAQTTVSTAVPSTLPTTMPVRTPTHAKVIYTQVPFSRDGIPRAYPGTLPYVVDGGGRFDAAPNPRVGREDSFWVGGYYGVGATQANGWKPTGERWMQYDDVKLDQFLGAFPPGGLLYVFDVETWKTDIRQYDAAAVEAASRRFLYFLTRARTRRPDGRWAVYATVPVHSGGDYYNGWKRDGSTAALAKQKRGEPLTEGDHWWIASAAEHLAQYSNWQHATDRLTYGIDAAGNRDESAGLEDAVDFFCPSGYIWYPKDSDDFLESFVRSMFEECRRINPAKRVLWFAWDKYAEDNKTQMPKDKFRRHCERMLRYGDGLLLWEIRDEEYIKIAVDVVERANRN